MKTAHTMRISFFAVAVPALTVWFTLVNCGGGSSSNPAPGCTAPAPPGGVSATKIVSASAGNDATASGVCYAYKTITAALAAASSGDVVWTAPGTYDAANGEIFPITVPAGVSLIGDVANKGNGTTATIIRGHGAVVSSVAGYAALISEATATIAGYTIDDTVNTLSSFGIYGDNSGMTAADNTFLSSFYGGVLLENSGDPLIRNNIFESATYGVYTACTGTATIQDNTFSENSFAIHNSSGNAIVHGNTITRSGAGNVGIRITGGSPNVQNNTFTAAGYTDGAIVAEGGTSPIVRTNTFNAGMGPAILTSGTAAPDLGTDVSAGNNVFSSVSGTVISHGSSTTIYAIGNIWPPALACGSKLVTSGTGTVIWGTWPTAHCPGPAPAADVTGGLAAYYACNGNVNDSIGTANGTAVGGLSYAADRFGTPNRAFSFNGTDAKVTVSDAISGGSTTIGYSVAVWVKRTSDTNLGVLVYGGNQFSLWESGGSVFFTAFNGSTSTTPQDPYPLNAWSQYVITYDDTTFSMKVYKDGAFVSDTNKGGKGGGLYLPTLDLGQNAYPYAGYWSGALDDVRFYDRPLSASEVLQLYQFLNY